MLTKSSGMAAWLPGTPCDFGLAPVVDATVRRLDPGDGDLAGVDHVNADWRDLARRFHQAPLDRGRTDAGKDVAAPLRVADQRLIDEDLQEEIVDIGIFACGG